MSDKPRLPRTVYLGAADYDMRQKKRLDLLGETLNHDTRIHIRAECPALHVPAPPATASPTHQASATTAHAKPTKQEAPAPNVGMAQQHTYGSGVQC
jgi:hypothetical protein